MIISSTDNFGGVDYLYQYAGTRPWHFQLVAAGIYPPFGGTAIGWTGRSVVITASDQFGHLGYWYDRRHRDLAWAASGEKHLRKRPGDRLNGQLGGHHRHQRAGQPGVLVAGGRHQALEQPAGSPRHGARQR